MVDQISITRALAELKTLDARINQKVSSQYVTFEIDNRLNGSKQRDDFASAAKQSMQSFKDLVERRNKLKREIVLSNARTSVKIGGNSYTVAEAIERKNSIMYEKMMLDSLRAQLRNVNAEIERINMKAGASLDSIIEKAVAVDTNKAADVVEQITVSYREKNFAKLFDPIEIEKAITALDESITQFEQDVDFVLSEVNATTKIEV